MALLLQAGTAGLYGVRAGMAALQGGDTLPLLLVMSSSSVAALGAMMKFKPRKPKSA